nr:hypothetical protein REQ54_03138 [Rhizobium sp. Q54]
MGITRVGRMRLDILNRDFPFRGCRTNLPMPQAKENAMKTFLVTASAFGLLTSVALAECAGHSKVTASRQLDQVTTTASVASEDEAVLVAKRKAGEEQAVTTE